MGDGRKKKTRSELDKLLKDDLNILLNLLPDEFEFTNGNYMYGEFSIADAMLTPLLLSYYSCNVKIPKNLASYLEFAISSTPMQECIA